jgi:diadenosine tetraphosphate (Ap4A) HIT family hydrolase
MLLSSSTTNFQDQFKQSLSKMLSPDELGAFILVLANSMQDAPLQDALGPKLKSTFSSLEAQASIQSTPDDRTVFAALKSTGISQHLSRDAIWKTRSIGKDNLWLCTYNPLRALRPARASKEAFTDLQKPFKEDSFHFDKAFLRAEIISKEEFDGALLQVMYHKFPFAPYHLLIVINAAQHQGQYLDQKAHQLSWNLATHIEKNIPGFGIAYNSLGAGASVNHLHIHSFVDKTLLAIEKPIWQHNGGTQAFPLNVTRCGSAQKSWQLIRQLHTKNKPYNLLYRGEVCYIIERKPQGRITLPAWMPSPGWYETCGGFNIENQTLFKNLTPDAIEAGLTLLRG